MRSKRKRRRYGQGCLNCPSNVRQSVQQSVRQKIQLYLKHPVEVKSVSFSADLILTGLVSEGTADSARNSSGLLDNLPALKLVQIALEIIIELAENGKHH
jgi:hypothetical protein